MGPVSRVLGTAGLIRLYIDDLAVFYKETRRKEPQCNEGTTPGNQKGTHKDAKTSSTTQATAQPPTHAPTKPRTSKHTKESNSHNPAQQSRTQHALLLADALAVI